MNDKSTPQEEEEKKGVGFYTNLGPVFGYFFRKKDPSRPTNGTIRAMHGINKLSIVMFLVGVVYMIIKYAMR